MTQRSEDFPAGEPWSVERQLEFDQMKRDAEFWRAQLGNRDPRESEKNLRGLDAENREALKRAGYKGNLSPLPPGEGSGQMVRKVTARPSFIETYEGDPDAWMDQFKPPVMHTGIWNGWRRLNDTEADWRARQDENRERLSAKKKEIEERGGTVPHFTC